MAGFQQWINPGHTVKVIEARGSPVKQRGHQTGRVSVVEMYEVSQLQRRGISLFLLKGSGKTTEEVVFRTPLAENVFWASLWKEVGRI